MTLINVTSLEMDYGLFRKTHALIGVDLKVEEGEVAGLVGPNGAGKSTLLKVITGILKQKSGRVEVSGQVGYIPELAACSDYLNPREHLDYFRGMCALSSDIEQALAQTGLTGTSKLARQLSKGMKRRIDIAIALAANPRVLVLDEPFEGLDPSMVIDLISILRELKDKGISMLISSHDLSGLEEVADVIYFIDGGEIVNCTGISSGGSIIRLEGEFDKACDLLRIKNIGFQTVGDNEILLTDAPSKVSEIIILLLSSGFVPAELRKEKLRDVYRKVIGNRHD
ncbi:MAG: ABC transporter ATP-binding protein [Nitrososphaerota archaeon]|nr:ABC transporter ATP-binding protein [Nitrososphaerota archaeon]